MPVPYPFADLPLARQLERTEARANAAFVTSRARLQPDSGATWQEVAGAYAMFDGVGSPLTQTFGLGLFEAVTDEHLQQLEEFFGSRGAEVFHEISPLAGPSLLARLAERGYRPVEVSSVLFRPTELAVAPSAHPDSGLRVRQTGRDEARLWARTAAEGWCSEAPDLVDFMLELGEISAGADQVFCFLAEKDGQPIAAGSLSLGEGVALLAGASTVPEGRKLGAQRALLEARLRFAAEQGYPLAMIATEPGSASQRNAERQGFRIAYTRTKWHRV
ncbi:GNAT family N-acetyltransferase [Tellurirhabdus rosea]|uniref:GNAT family N-acetyltransferase n=1 Tax=Tellurirhabdus rosea TaxID=2674997 RepID=UPI002253103B|nr:GNAT family N-acetyltransferase [Tellurirhabdus rosea]